MTAATESTNSYRRNRVLTTLMVVNTLLFAVCGLINISVDESFLSLIWFCGAIVFYINFLWSKRTPFITFSNEGIMLRPAMARPKRQITWQEIASVKHESKNKAYLVLKNGERVKITLYSINKEDRVPFMRRLNAEIDNTVRD